MFHIRVIHWHLFLNVFVNFQNWFSFYNVDFSVLDFRMRVVDAFLRWAIGIAWKVRPHRYKALDAEFLTVECFARVLTPWPGLSYVICMYDANRGELQYESPVSSILSLMPDLAQPCCEIRQWLNFHSEFRPVGELADFTWGISRDMLRTRISRLIIILRWDHDFLLSFI